MKRTAWLVAGLTCVWLGGVNGFAAESASTPETAAKRVGVYDSRVIAYADFWSDAHQKRNNDLIKSAREAKAAGQTEQFHKLDAALKAEQERNHLQVFSTAPVDDILAGMKEQVAAIQKETGTTALVSKWDEQALRAHEGVVQVEVTDRLLREFKLNEKQVKVVESMRQQKPLPLEKAKELVREGKL